MKYSKNIIEFRKNFDYAYYTVVKPLAEDYECDRIRINNTVIIISTIYILIDIFLICTGQAGFYVIAINLYFVIFGIIIYCGGKKIFEKKLKDEVMPEIQQCFGEIQWSNYNGYDDSFAEAGLFDTVLGGDIRAQDDDVFKGFYKNVPLKIIETRYYVGSGKSTCTVFRGVIIELQMNKDFSGHTLLCNDSLLHKSPIKNLKWTKLEDVEFEKKYDVFTNDKIEARYILTPSFIEKLKKINFAFDSDKIRCAFYKNKLLIAIPTEKDLFSIGSLHKPVADYKQFSTLCEQFVSILSLIDYLQLDEKVTL